MNNKYDNANPTKCDRLHVRYIILLRKNKQLNDFNEILQ